MKRIQRSFSGGEVSPFVYPLTGIHKRIQGLAKAKNVIVKKFGSIENRPGTEYIGPVDGSSRLVPFTDSTGVAYLLEFKHREMVVWRNGQTEVELQTPFSSSVIKELSFSQQADRLIILSNFTIPMEVARRGVTSLDNRPATSGGGATLVRRQRNNDRGADGQEDNRSLWSINEMFLGRTVSRVGSLTAASSIAAGGLRFAFAVTTVYSTGEESIPVYAHYDGNIIPNLGHPVRLRWANTGSLGTVERYNVYLRRGGDYFHLASTRDRQFDYIGEQPDSSRSLLTGNGPFYKEAEEYNIESFDIDGTPSILVTQKQDKPIVGQDLYFVNFPTEDEDRGSERPDSGVVRVAIGYGEAVGKAVLVDRFTRKPIPLPANGYRTKIILTPVDDMPSTSAFFGQRLLVASSRNQPENIWVSRLGDYLDFQPPLVLLDSSSYDFSLATNKFSKILHIAALRVPILFTGSSEWALNEGLSATGITPSPQSQYGADSLPPEVVENSVVFSQNGSTLRDYGFNFESGGYKGSDLTTFASHLFEGRRIVSTAFAKLPDPVFWVVLDDGKFLSLTYFREQQIFAWCRHSTDGLVKQVEVTNQPQKSETYFLIERNGQTFLERLSDVDRRDENDLRFTDSHVVVDMRNKDASKAISVVSVPEDEPVYGLLTARQNTPVVGYTFTGYAGEQAATDRTGDIRGTLSEEIGGIYTATVKTSNLSPLQLIKEGSSYYAKPNGGSGKNPRTVRINGIDYPVGPVINVRFFEIIGFDGFQNGEDYRIQVTFTDGSNWITASPDFGPAYSGGTTFTFNGQTGDFDPGERVNIVFEGQSYEVFTERLAQNVYRVTPDRPFPANIDGATIVEWVGSASSISLPHLVGKTVSIYADGSVIASLYHGTGKTVPEGGIVKLGRPYSYICAGLTYVSDLKTLPVDVRGQNTIADENMIVQKMALYLHNTRGLYLGAEEPVEEGSLDGLVPRKTELTKKVPSTSGLASQIIEGRWGKNGEVFVRQVDPLPFTIQGVVIGGDFPHGDGRLRA